MLDDYTLQHLAAWLEKHERPEDMEQLKGAMLAVLADDPSLADLGWPRVREIAVSA